MRPTRFTSPEDPELLASPSWGHCEALIQAFEEACRQGQRPSLAAYLLAPDPARQALLVELAHVDLEFRLKAGEPARVERYLEAYPELAARRRTVLGLLAAEYEVRRHAGESVDLEEYRLRFPDHYADLVSHLKPAGRETLIPPPPTLIPARRASPPTVPGYDLVEELGRGGMGVVYKARDTSLGRPVALKFLPAEYTRDPDRLTRFLREARTASALNHPHICTVHDLKEHEGRPFIVMEFIEGKTLQSLIAERPGVEEVVRVVTEAARALAAAHAAGVVHRDVKPENVMVRHDGYVKVLDFGLARRLPTLVKPDAGTDCSTDPGAVLGTPAYMSPEQARGQPADSASDVFSLGIVLYELATGEHPFAADSALGLLHAIATREPVAPALLQPELPAALGGLIEAMLHKDARLRPAAAEVVAALEALPSQRDQRPHMPPAAGRPIVRREPELAALRAALRGAAEGRGSLVCVAGEPGIGKTTLVEDFLAEAEASGAAALVARGHCSERLADTEAYLPALDALGGLLRAPGGDGVARLMKVVAPTWHACVTPAQPAAGEAASHGARSQQAMLREFRNLLQEASRLGPVVLFFDDVHWADLSTVDLLAHLGRHSAGMRVLVVVTYRLTEMLLGPHPFHRVQLELLGKGACTELRLGFLRREDVDRYLTLAFPGHEFTTEFADLVYRRTEGSPLFLADLLRYLRERGVLAEQSGRWALARELPDLLQELPDSIKGMIARKLEQVEEADRRLLSAAAVQGPEFDSAVVAAALGLDPADAEERLQRLDRVHGLVRLVREEEFPDRTLTQRYAFVHGLYQQALYRDLSPSRRASLGAALARALGSHHEQDSPTAAAELGCLFEVGRDFAQAARQFWTAAQNAARVFAHRDAVGLARRGLRLLASLPETPARAALELPLQMTLGLQLQVTEGYASPAAKEAYVRARDLCPLQARGTDAPRGVNTPFPVLWGLWLYYKVRSELSRATELADELHGLAKRQGDADLELQAQQALGITALCRGEPLAAVRHVEQAAVLYDPARHRTHAFLFGQDPGVICKAFGAVALWLLGYPDQAQRQGDEAITMSLDQSPNSQSVALHFASMVHQLRGEAKTARRRADASCAIAGEHGFSFWMAGGNVLGGWALAASGAAEDGGRRLAQGLAGWAATGSVTYQTYYLGLRAEVLLRLGRAEEAARTLEEALALAEQTGERFYEAELLRLQGELPGRGPGEREEAFRRALAVARRQEARSLELRTAISLARLGSAAEYRQPLAEAFAWFTEGLGTADLTAARELLGAGQA